jgi:hypothetical protein
MWDERAENEEIGDTGTNVIKRIFESNVNTHESESRNCFSIAVDVKNST